MYVWECPKRVYAHGAWACRECRQSAEVIRILHDLVVGLCSKVEKLDAKISAMKKQDSVSPVASQTDTTCGPRHDRIKKRHVPTPRHQWGSRENHLNIVTSPGSSPQHSTNNNESAEHARSRRTLNKVYLQMWLTR